MLQIQASDASSPKSTGTGQAVSKVLDLPSSTIPDSRCNGWAALPWNCTGHRSHRTRRCLGWALAEPHTLAPPRVDLTPNEFQLTYRVQFRIVQECTREIEYNARGSSSCFCKRKRPSEGLTRTEWAPIKKGKPDNKRPDRTRHRKAHFERCNRVQDMAQAHEYAQAKPKGN